MTDGPRFLRELDVRGTDRELTLEQARDVFAEAVDRAFDLGRIPDVGDPWADRVCLLYRVPPWIVLGWPQPGRLGRSWWHLRAFRLRVRGWLRHARR